MPASQKDLIRLAESFAGFTIEELTQKFHIDSLPEKTLHAKGWLGQFIEKILGATAGNQPIPDFESLQIELKTVPIDAQGKPMETTYVTVVPLKSSNFIIWRQSAVYQKLKKVLWIPYQGSRDIAFCKKMLGMPVLWAPNAAQEALLQNDWENHMEKIALGFVETITAHQGEVLQIRPKAAHSKVTTPSIGGDGSPIVTLPRGFYLRTQFTAQILRESR